MYSESHCHLDAYDPELLTKKLEEAVNNNVGLIVSTGMSLDSSEKTIRLAEKNETVVAAVGIHPWNAAPPTEALKERLKTIASRKGVAALGEIGLDYNRGPDTREIQKDLLRYELSLAMEMDLPVNIHSREAHHDMMEILGLPEYAGLKGNIHGFSGDSKALNDWLKLGFYISIGLRGLLVGEVPALIAAVPEIPADRILTETDAAGPQSSPAGVVLVAEKLAEIRKTGPDEIGQLATDNLKRLLQI
jgi:TatD DNase family protein